MATQNFSDWTSEIDKENYNEVQDLYDTVDSLSNGGSFTIQEANGKNNGWIVSGMGMADTLHIASEQARQAFLSFIKTHFCDGMEVNGWVAMKHDEEQEARHDN